MTCCARRRARKRRSFGTFGTRERGTTTSSLNLSDRADPEAVARAREAVGETFAASVELGGTISGEHGIGYVKAPYLSMALGGETIEAMRRIKRALDPQGILNPGKMFV